MYPLRIPRVEQPPAPPSTLPARPRFRSPPALTLPLTLSLSLSLTLSLSLPLDVVDTIGIGNGIGIGGGGGPRSASFQLACFAGRDTRASRPAPTV